MAVYTTLAQRLSDSGLNFASNLVIDALMNDALRDVVGNEIEKRLVDQRVVYSDQQLPQRVRQDKADMARALLNSVDRSLKRKQISRKVLRMLIKSLLVKVVLRQDEDIQAAEQAFMERHNGTCPPTTMVISPTKACNLRCAGCYANSGATPEQLGWEVLDRIVTEAKEQWGMRFFTISGGEPLVYRSQGKELLDLALKHDDCFFQMYTNGVLIDREMARRLEEAGNMIPAISVEGFQERTDARRGEGVFAHILEAMANLRVAGVPFGISLTATRQNAEEILSDAFIDYFFEKQQAVFGWVFQYMPIGRSYTLELLVTPAQRLWMWQRTWQIIRERKIMLADFWNCGVVTDGCIAAARDRGYFYIDWNGNIMPCVFVPYAAANVHEIYARGGTIGDIYDLPYFRAIRQWQTDYVQGKESPEQRGNWLLPCSLRDHYQAGRRLIDIYRPVPEDEAAADALLDGNYYEGMLGYNEELRELFDPTWEKEYLENA